MSSSYESPNKDFHISKGTKRNDIQYSSAGQNIDQAGRGGYLYRIKQDTEYQPDNIFHSNFEIHRLKRWWWKFNQSQPGGEGVSISGDLEKQFVNNISHHF